jgi:aspartate kinase
VTDVTVIKIGGSVLTGVGAYRRAAAFVASRVCECPGTRFVVVVSAEQGATDALLAAARDLSPEPEPVTLDLLWSTGELRSVALLVLALHALGVRAGAVNVHQTGLTAPDGGSSRTGLRALRLRSQLALNDVVVVPGFLAWAAGDAVVSLGRGGSDLTAVLLAAGLDADSCELIKDVPGYFSSDPNSDPDARHIPVLDYGTALAMSDRGCDLVQRLALEAARAALLPVVVRSMTSQRQTVVCDLENSILLSGRERNGHGVCDTYDSCGAAV